jgi:pimeloyl-ACP methyl ester carboxylesterase
VRVEAEESMPYITSDGANLFLDTAGTGTPIVFVHEYGLDRRQWDPQWDDLSRDAEVVRVDLRAHGRSAAVAVADPAVAATRDLERALVQLGIDRLRPGFLVAHGHAAVAALQVAIDEPRSLRGVVLVSPATAGQWPEDWRQLWDAMRADAGAGRVGAALERWRADSSFDGVRELPAAWAAIESMHAGCTGTWWAQAGGAVRPAVHFAACKVPVLIVSGRRDRSEQRQAAADLAAVLPAAEVFEVDAGHFPNLEQPLEFTRRVREFIARHR